MAGLSEGKTVLADFKQLLNNQNTDAAHEAISIVPPSQGNSLVEMPPINQIVLRAGEDQEPRPISNRVNSYDIHGNHPRSSRRDDSRHNVTPNQSAMVIGAELESSQGNMRRSLRDDDSRYSKSRSHPSSGEKQGVFKSVGRFFGGNIPDRYPENELMYDAAPPKNQYGHDDRGFAQRNEKSLSRELDLLRQDNAELRQSLKEEQAKLGKFIQSADRMQKNMDSKELFLGDQASDDDLQRDFRGLLNQIKTWAAKLREGHALSRQDMDENVADELEAVCPGCLMKDPRFWQSGKKVRLLIRGWVGFVIAKTIFRARSDNLNDYNDAFDRWMGTNVSHAVATIEDRLSFALQAGQSNISMKNLHDWRSLTVGLLSRFDLGTESIKQVDNFVEGKAQEMMRVVGFFVPEKERNEVIRGLMQILGSAISLSRVLRKQRAYWWVVGPVPTSKQPIEGSTTQVRSLSSFNPEYMQDDLAEDDEQQAEVARKKYVNMFMAPGLMRRGDLDGEGYSYTTCVVPILVTCR